MKFYHEQKTERKKIFSQTSKTIRLSRRGYIYVDKIENPQVSHGRQERAKHMYIIDVYGKQRVECTLISKLKYT